MSTGKYHYVEVTGIVVRSAPVKGSRNHSVSVEFININEKRRQLIIQYCFEQQMQMRKRKRL
ncbi:hypothetical protein [Halobacillus andaensis]